MNKRSRIRWLDLSSDNPKSKTCPFEKLRAGSELGRRIKKQPRRPKWVRVVAIIVAFAFGGVAVEAQQPTKLTRIGYVSGTGDANTQGPYVEALRRGMREHGYVEGKNFVIEYRGAEGKLDRIPSLIAQLVNMKVDILVLPFLDAVRAAKQATKTISIVMVIGTDPVAEGLIDSLAHPGGNVTGISTLAGELGGKRLELLKEVVPRLARVGVLRYPDNASEASSVKEYETAARALKIKLHRLNSRGTDSDLEAAFKKANKERVGALVTITHAELFRQKKRIADLAIKNRLPTIFQGSAWVESGGLMSYASDDLDAYRYAATLIDKLIKGRKPSDLPVEQAMKFEFVVNLKTAQQIRLTMPQWTLMKADRVIR